jgi:HPt (histidine-containing phosphotransfer) domain-containing protein
MLTSFISGTGNLLKDLKNAVSARQWESAADIAHKSMSPCRHIGAMDLYNILGTIEKATRSNDFSIPVEKLAENALAEFEEISSLLNGHIAKIK